MCRKGAVSSDHSLDKSVNESLSVSEGTSVGEGVSLLLESLQGGGELEWPQEVVGLLEVWANSANLVDEVLVARDTVLSEGLVNDARVSQWNSRSSNLSVSSLVDEILDGLSSWVSISDEWLDSSDHGHGGLVHSHENGVVKLSKSQQLHDLLALWAQLVDTKQKCGY